MAAIDFPNSPSVNDTHTVGDRTWKWNGSVWAVVRAVDLLVGPTGATGAVGNTGPTGTFDPGVPVSSITISGPSIVFEGATANDFETTLTVTDPTADRTITLPDSTGTVALTGNKLSVFAATTSSELAGVISDETGSGALVFGTSPTISTPALTLSTTTNSAEGRIAWDSTADKIVVGDGSATVEFAPSTLVLNAQTGTTYTFALTDKDKLVTASNASAQTYSIPTNANAAFPVGSRINIIAIGAGQVTITAVTPATTTIASTGATATSPKLRAQYSSATLMKVATDTWYVIGDLA